MASDTRKAASEHVPRRGGLHVSVYHVAAILVFGCFVSLTVTFLHVGVSLDELAARHDTVVHVPAVLPKNAAPLQYTGKLPSADRMRDLDCSRYGGPSPDMAREMVYWQDIPSDASYRSPFYDANSTTRKYLTFEPDDGGFNNVRMAMEIVLVMAHAMGRTLVMPAEQEVYLLYNDRKDNKRATFGFQDFFPLDEIAKEQAGLEIITMDQFLEQEGITGRLHEQSTGRVSFPPHNRTNWNGMTDEVIAELQPWQQTVSVMPSWDPEKCLAAFPKSSDPADMESLRGLWTEIEESGGFPSHEAFIGRPVSVYGSAMERLKENSRQRNETCLYDAKLQKEPVLHFHGKDSLGGRLLAHFYTFLFFEDWRQDLWTKRFVRDHIRYKDEIQCAAARIVNAVRERARRRDPTNVDGHFDAFHIRRGEFQYKRTRVSAREIYERSSDEIADGTTVYIATDERNKAFFQDMAEHYDLVYLDDFTDLLGGISSNYYGMVDQLVASRSRVFFGCYFSTFSGYINRIRGYHADRLKLAGFGDGVIESYYYAFPAHKMRMREYWPVSGILYAREFPVSWRNIDQGIGRLALREG